jgi:hypothetical protein
MALTNLIEEFRDLFRESKISKAHANLLCPLTAEEQQILYQQHFANKDYTGFNQYCQIPRPGELRRTIQRDFFLELGAAPFDTADPALVAAAGSCLDCPKRSGNSPALFVDMKATNTCTDPTCYKVKVDVYISQLAETTLAKTKKPLLRLSKHDHSKLEGVLKPSQWRRAKAGECELLRKGILVEEYYSDKKELYKTITVCIDKECPKHWGPDAAPSEDDPRGEQKVKDKAKMDKIKAVVAQRREVADALMEVALKPLDDFMLKEAAKKLYNRVEGAYRKQIASKWYDIEPRVTKTEWGTYKDVEGGMIATIEEMNTKELGQFITMCVVAPEALAGAGSYQYSDEKSWSKTTLNRIAEHYGLDPKKIKPEKKERK